MLLRTVSILWLALSVPSLAEPKAYEPVAVSYDQGAAGDAALRALVQKLHAAVAERQLPAVDAVLSPAFAVIECDADPTKPCTPATKGAVRSNPKMPPPARIRWALCCKDIAPAKITKTLRDETVLGLIGAALEEDTIGAHPLLPGAACLPAWPLFDAAKAAKLAAQADVERDNLRVTSAEIVLRTKPEGWRCRSSAAGKRTDGRAGDGSGRFPARWLDSPRSAARRPRLHRSARPE